jgi:hypothetical protein
MRRSAKKLSVQQAAHYQQQPLQRRGIVLLAASTPFIIAGPAPALQLRQ